MLSGKTDKASIHSDLKMMKQLANPESFIFFDNADLDLIYKNEDRGGQSRKSEEKRAISEVIREAVEFNFIKIVDVCYTG